MQMLDLIPTRMGSRLSVELTTKAYSLNFLGSDPVRLLSQFNAGVYAQKTAGDHFRALCLSSYCAPDRRHAEDMLAEVRRVPNLVYLSAINCRVPDDEAFSRSILNLVSDNPNLVWLDYQVSAPNQQSRQAKKNLSAATKILSEHNISALQTLQDLSEGIQFNRRDIVTINQTLPAAIALWLVEPFNQDQKRMPRLKIVNQFIRELDSFTAQAHVLGVPVSVPRRELDRMRQYFQCQQCQHG